MYLKRFRNPLVFLGLIVLTFIAYVKIDKIYTREDVVSKITNEFLIRVKTEQIVTDNALNKYKSNLAKYGYELKSIEIDGDIYPENQSIGKKTRYSTVTTEVVSTVKYPVTISFGDKIIKL